MRRCLVVANQTLGGDELLAQIRQRTDAGPCRFHLLVPATPADQLDPQYLADRSGTVTGRAAPGVEDPDRAMARQLLEDELEEPRVVQGGEDLGRRLARDRLRHELGRLRELGVDASGEVGVSDPVEAIRVVLHRLEFDEVILSTLPSRRSRWLAMDLPSKIRRTFKLPVTVVTGARTSSP